MWSYDLTRKLLSLQMRRTPSPRILNSTQIKQSPHLKHELSTINSRRYRSKRVPVLSYIEAAAKKVSRVLKIMFVWRSKTTGGIIDGSKSNTRDQRIAFPSDVSTGSTSSTGKSWSKFKSSSSYSSSSATSGQVGTGTFSFEEIYKATEKFSPQNVIGEGNFATVYKGRLRDGSLVAVKRTRKNSYERPSFSDFRNEVRTLSQIEHLSLVRLHGYLEHGHEQIIVVEYIGNGTLRDHLDCKKGNGLEISHRLDIATDVAHAITYLHKYTGNTRYLSKDFENLLQGFDVCNLSSFDPPIIHRDIKSSNILITEKFRAKVADFGFARLGTENADDTHISTQIKGTTGYLDPEYLRTYQLTEKSDVYSFGVLLVEMMTGRRPIDIKRPIEERVTSKWAMQRLKQGDAIMVMDPLLRRSPASNMAVEEVLKLAHRCLAPLIQSRPSMRQCGEALWGIRKNFRERTQAVSTPSTPHQSADFPYRDSTKSRDTSFGIKDDDSYKFISA